MVLCFSAHGFLILVLELGFRRLVETLYCIVNILYNAMKETKRVSESLRKLVFPFGVSKAISMYLCVNAIVQCLILLKNILHCNT